MSKGVKKSEQLVAGRARTAQRPIPVTAVRHAGENSRSIEDSVIETKFEQLTKIHGSATTSRALQKKMLSSSEQHADPLTEEGFPDEITPLTQR